MTHMETVTEWILVQRLYPTVTKVQAIRDTDNPDFDVFRAAFQAWRGAPGSSNYSQALEWAHYDDTDLTGDFVAETTSLPVGLRNIGESKKYD